MKNNLLINFGILMLSVLTIFGCKIKDEPVVNTKPKIFKPKLSLTLQETKESNQELYFQRTKDQQYYIDNNKKPENGWTILNIAKSNAKGYVQYEIMKNVVTEYAYNGYGDKTIGVRGISFFDANEYCSQKLNAQLMSPYIFDSAREQLKLFKPNSLITMELMSPFDEDEDEDFIYPNDNIAVNVDSDSTFIIIKWNSEKYYSVSNTFKSNELSFRCMKRK